MKRRLLAVGLILLLCAVAVWAATQGPLNPTVATGGASVWTNPAGIKGTATFATEDISASGTSDTLNGSSFGFSIPAGATINGFTVSFVRKQSSGTGGQLETANVFMTKVAGTGTGTGHIGTTNWTGSNVTETWGSGSDLWGTTWTVAQVNATGFGFQMTVLENGGVNDEIANVQNFLITVTYTPLPAGRNQGVIVGQTQTRQGVISHSR